MKKKRASATYDRVSVICDNVKLPFARKFIKKVAARILSLLNERGTYLSILFVNDTKMSELNYKYRKTGKATDCLAFPMREGTDRNLHPEMLGDVVISVEAARRNARTFRSTVRKETSLYIIHGILHLLGYKDTTSASIKRMKKLEEELLNRL